MQPGSSALGTYKHYLFEVVTCWFLELQMSLDYVGDAWLCLLGWLVWHTLMPEICRASRYLHFCSSSAFGTIVLHKCNMAKTKATDQFKLQLQFPIQLQLQVAASISYVTTSSNFSCGAKLNSRCWIKIISQPEPEPGTGTSFIPGSTFTRTGTSSSSNFGAVHVSTSLFPLFTTEAGT